jgi:cell division protein FtsB
MKRIGGIESSRDVTKLGDLVEKLAAENSILQARIKELQNAVFIEKKRRKRGKPCIKNICTINEGKATFWSPTKLESTK